jgi:hypothetical protein
MIIKTGKYSSDVPSGIFAAIFGVLYAISSTMSFNDEIVSEQHTCSMVQNNAWPAEQAENYNCAEPVQVAGVDDGNH